ncbi:MAG TPA: peptidylprolyl isomerase [Edaphocola sp.]|nr:peptidylprolyl isomerase [Edaphocola sp.]
MFKKSYLLAIMIGAATASWGQKEVADKIVGVVGNNIILQSDVDLQYHNDPSLSDVPEEDAKCNIIYTLLAQQLLVEQAARDSVIVSDDEVETQIDQRIRSFIQRFGSREALEQASGQSIYQLKETYRSFFKDKLTAERMQQKIMDNVKITPSEVKDFFNKIPADSLPMLPATIEMGEIVIKPTISPEIEQLAKDKLEDIRKDIVSGGKSFSTMASIYSMDPSRNNGGLITINKKDFDPQFVAAAYRLQPGEISPVIKTRFGYHIIQMVRRMGDEAQVRHILIIPEVTSVGIDRTMKKLDSVRADLIAGKITFSQAVGQYSTDEMAKMTGGMILDPRTGSAALEINNLQDQDVVKAAGTLKIGEFSQPQIFRDERTQTQQCRILYLKSRSTPHRLNLKDDYSLIQQKALAKKQNDFLFNWVKDKSKDYYIHVDPEYKDCRELKDWQLDNAPKSE